MGNFFIRIRLCEEYCLNEDVYYTRRNGDNLSEVWYEESDEDIVELDIIDSN